MWQFLKRRGTQCRSLYGDLQNGTPLFFGKRPCTLVKTAATVLIAAGLQAAAVSAGEDIPEERASLGDVWGLAGSSFRSLNYATILSSHSK